MTRKNIIQYYITQDKELRLFFNLRSTLLPYMHLCALGPSPFKSFIEISEFEGPSVTFYLASVLRYNSEGHEILQQARSGDAQANDDS